MQQVKVIGLIEGFPTQPHRALFESLTTVFPVRFKNVDNGCWGGLDAAIFLGVNPSDTGIPSLHLPAASTSDVTVTAKVQFAQNPAVPVVLRGRSLRQEHLIERTPLISSKNDEIIATLDGDPVWIRRKAKRNTDFFAMSLSATSMFRSLFECFGGQNFFRILPLIEFLRRLTSDDQWISTGLRACFMFDDPNLHSSRYGWVDYAELAQHANAHDYHASMATIPLDSWFESNRAVRLFLDQQRHLSLLIHGNDHLHNELANFTSDQERLGALAQALKRISRLEAKTGIEVSRVMAAPHGACCEETLRAMARLGFEAACISHGSLYTHNSDKAWTRNIGLGVSEFVAGLPVIPRFRLSYESENAILLAAYLDQPIIPMGHHQDVAAGLDLLEELAGFVNSLGKVRWMSMKGIARSNYQTRTDGSLLQVRSYSRVFNLSVPPGVTQVSVHRPGKNDQVQEQIHVRRTDKAGRVFSGSMGEPFPVESGTDLEITCRLQDQIDPSSVRQPKLRIWPFARRILTESRDRLAPVASRLKRNVLRG